MTSKNAGVKGVDRLSVNIKYMINYAGNCLTNQNGDINYVHDILSDESKCEFILGIDTVLCDSMKYADVILPDMFRFEQNTQIGTGGDNAYMMHGYSVHYAEVRAQDGVRDGAADRGQDGHEG